MAEDVLLPVQEVLSIQKMSEVCGVPGRINCTRGFVTEYSVQSWGSSTSGARGEGNQNIFSHRARPTFLWINCGFLRFANYCIFFLTCTVYQLIQIGAFYNKLNVWKIIFLCDAASQYFIVLFYLKKLNLWWRCFSFCPSFGQLCMCVWEMLRMTS